MVSHQSSLSLDRKGGLSPRRSAPVLLLLGALSLLTLAGCHPGAKTAAGKGPLDFNQDVQPILASNCFSCHGPDPEMRKAGLRLDLEESARRKRPGHADAIVAGDPDHSELIRRIESRDVHHLMPQSPQGEARPMKAEEIAVLRQWIKEGAVYRPHWAFEAPVKTAVPDAPEDRGQKQPAGSTANNAIDRFVQARLRKEGLHGSPEAGKEAQIRRVTLDLTGLLPTPDEVIAFKADTSPMAYERLVDRLMARPAFGEQRARYWLDYARYSDTYGLHFDNSRNIWPYRDYVIRSFNANKPFDQFAMEQIAGDLMPAKTLDPLIGSGYVRLGVSSNEGGTIPEELKFNIARERTEAYGAAFLGLTVGCAVCHDHKYDPTTQKDFYALSAFFNNVDEEPFNKDRPVWEPALRIPDATNQEAFERILGHRSALAADLALARKDAGRVDRWLASGANPALPVSTAGLKLRLRLDEGGGEVLHNSAPNPQPSQYAIGKAKPQWGETTWLWPDFRMDTSTRVMLGDMGDYQADEAFSSGGWFMLRSAPNLLTRGVNGALISKMNTKQHSRGWDISMAKGFVTVNLVHQQAKDGKQPPGKDLPRPKGKDELFHFPTPTDLSAEDLAPAKSKYQKAKEKQAKAEAPRAHEKAEPPDTTETVGIKVASTDPLPLDGQWRHIFFTYDGSGRAAGVKLFVDGRPITTRVVSDNLNHASIRTEAPMQLGWRYPDAGPAKDTRYQDIRLYQRPLSPAEVSRLPFEDYVAELAGKVKVAEGSERKPGSTVLNRDQWHAVKEFYWGHVDDSAQKTGAQIALYNQELERLSRGGAITQVAWEKPTIAYAHVLTRGVYSARAERVEADTPHFLPPLPRDVEHNRLALARWTVSERNPLTARVTVNRMWNELFGAGLVETTEDFGIMGQRASNPELLDWLAVEFRQSGWDVKHMYRLMVTSAAYRQSARATPEQLSKDPKNLLLSHGPRFRMDAEMVRDVALQSADLLAGAIGGPSVKPYQPANVWEQVSYPTSDTLYYEQGAGQSLYRRSMYTYWKRMATPPNMDAFDAPMRDTVCTRRQRTDTPLQALVTLNDTQWVEAARGLAQRVIEKGGADSEQRIRMLSDILLSHDPSPQMKAVLLHSLDQMQAHYRADPGAAKALIKVGESKADAAIPAPELAAWTMIASEVLNLDETLNK